MITPLRSHGREYPPLWRREEYPCQINVNYLPVQWQFSFKYMSSSDERMQAFQSRLAHRIALSNVVMLEGVHYLLTLPKSFYTLMTLFHQMEEAVYPQGETFIDWMGRYAVDSKGFKEMTNQLGKGGHPVFHEVQQDLVLMLEMTEIPEKERREKNPGSSVDFEVQVHWSRPHAMSLHYPVTVFNQLVPRRFLPRVEHRRPKAGQTGVSDILQHNLYPNMNNYYQHQFTSYTEAHGISVPIEDDWAYASRQLFLRPVFTAMVRIKEDHAGSVQVATLKQLKRYITFSPAILRFLKEDPMRLVANRFSPLMALVVRDQTRLSSALLQVDENLTVTTTQDLTRKDVLHVQYCIPVHYRNYPDEFFSMIRLYPDLVMDILGMQKFKPITISNVVSRINELSKRTKVFKRQLSIWMTLYNRLEWTTPSYWLMVEMCLVVGLRDFKLSKVVMPLFEAWLAERDETITYWDKHYRYLEKLSTLQEFSQLLWSHLNKEGMMSKMSFWGVLDERCVRQLLKHGLDASQIETQLSSGGQLRTVLSFGMQAMRK